MPPLTGVCKPYGPRVTWYCIAAATTQVTLALASLHTPVKGRAWRHRLSPTNGLSEHAARRRALPQAPKDARRRLAALSTTTPLLLARHASRSQHTGLHPLHTSQTEKRSTHRTHPTRQLLTTTRNLNHRPPAATRQTTPTAIRRTRSLMQNAPPLITCH
jgi:hypothetical protein